MIVVLLTLNPVRREFKCPPSCRIIRCRENRVRKMDVGMKVVDARKLDKPTTKDAPVWK
jgi:hypothetical protein